jgi:DNA invertase Pin-like site-specific DNA recombinase
MLGAFAEFETNLRRERQVERIAKAKAAGVYKGSPPSIEASRVRELKAQGMRSSDIAKALKIGRASVYRVLGQGATRRLRRSMELLNETAPPLPWPPSAARWLLIPTGWTTLVLAVILVIL